MTGQRGVKRDLRSLLISNLAEQNDIGILSEDRAQRGREAEAYLFAH